MKNDMIDFLKKSLYKKHQSHRKDLSKLKDHESKMEVYIDHPSFCAFVFNIPSGGGVHLSMLAGIKGYKQSCDKLMFIAHDGWIDVYFIELKESKTPTADVVLDKACNQILATVPVLDYLVSMAKIHDKEPPEIKTHFAVITKKPAPMFDKQSVKPQLPEIRECNGHAFTVFHSVPKILYEQLRTP